MQEVGYAPLVPHFVREVAYCSTGAARDMHVPERNHPHYDHMPHMVFAERPDVLDDPRYLHAFDLSSVYTSL